MNNNTKLKLKKIKNKLTITRGEVEQDNGAKGGRVFRNIYKGYMEKTKVGVRSRVGSGVAGMEGSDGGKMETTVLE